MRVLATWAFSFAAGIFLAQYLLPIAWQLPLCLLWLALGGLGLLAAGKRETMRKRVVLVSGAVTLAMVYNWGYTAIVQSPAELLADTERPQVTMTLLDYAQSTDYGAKATVRLGIEGLRGVKAIYYGDEAMLELAPGQTVTNDIALSSAARVRDDDVTTFTSKGVFLLAYSRGEETTGAGSADSVRWLPQRVAFAMKARIAQLFEGDMAGFLVAILTGDKSAVSQSAGVDLSEAGLYHMLAVSGMHCAYLLALVALFTGHHRRRLTAIVAIPVLLFYMLLAGCSPSVVRACVMLVLLLAAPLLGRENDPPTAMAAALLLILLQNPFSVASISLQLSFAAIAGIIWAAPGIYRFLTGERQWGRVARFVLLSVSVSLGVTVCSAPLSAYYFNTLWLISPLSNLLCLWAAGATFCFGLLAVAGSFVWLPIGTVLGWVPTALIWYLLTVAKWLAKIPYHAVYFSNPYLKYWLALLYVLFVLASVMKPRTRRAYAVAAGLSALTLGVTVWLGTLRYTYSALDVTVLDVGQGESVAVVSGGEFALIDCGSSNRWYSAGEIAADALVSMGCHRLEYLMLTHYDYDHVSGVSELLDRLPVDTLLLPDTEDDSGLRTQVVQAAEKHGVAVEYVTQEGRYRLGETTVTVYPPLGTEGDNQMGLTYLCTAGDYDLLVTGDMDSATERLLLERYRLPDIEALVVGHHGSKGSTSEELLSQLRPETAVISVGSNSYGHPTRQTLKRLLSAETEIFRTDLQGNIYIHVN